MQTQDTLLNTHTTLVEDAARATSSRIYDPFRAVVRGADKEGDEFRVETVLDSFGTRELSMRLPNRIEQGARLFIVVRLSDGVAEGVEPLRVAVRGMVERVERKPSCSYQVSVSFTKYRMF